MVWMRQHSIVVDAPAATIYDYVADLTRHPEWAAQPMQMTASGPGEARSVVDFRGMPIKAKVKIVEERRPTLLAYESTDLAGHYRWTFDLEPAGDATKVTHRVERLSAPMWVPLIQSWLMWPMSGGPGSRQGLANLKRRLEAGQSGATASAGA